MKKFAPQIGGLILMALGAAAIWIGTTWLDGHRQRSGIALTVVGVLLAGVGFALVGVY